MGKLLLLLLLSAAAAGLHHAASVGDGSRAAAAQAAEGHRLVLAREAALTGWARAKGHLAADFASKKIEGDNDGAQYTTDVIVTGDRALVVSTGRLDRPGWAGETTYRVAHGVRKNPVLAPRPRFMDYALIAGGDLEFKGESRVVQRGVTDGSADTLSIRVHGNGHLHRTGDALVEGFGTYATSVSAGIDGAFQPHYNPGALPTVYAAPHVPVPTVDPDALVAEDGVDVEFPAGTSLRGVTLPGGTRLEPRVYRFRGAAKLRDVTVDGYAVLVADGDVELVGTVRGRNKGYAGPEESALAIYTPGRLVADGATTVHAQILAGAGATYKGETRIYGSLALGGDYTQSGASTIYYRPASPALTQGFTGRPHPLTLLAVREQ